MTTKERATKIALATIDLQNEARRFAASQMDGHPPGTVAAYRMQGLADVAERRRAA